MSLNPIVQTQESLKLLKDQNTPKILSHNYIKGLYKTKRRRTKEKYIESFVVQW